jgi:GntR family transcriptional regulator
MNNLVNARFTPDINANAVNDSVAFIQRLRPDTGIAEPVYRQLQRQIIHMIQAGELGEGDSLPSERVLAEALRLSK